MTELNFPEGWVNTPLSYLVGVIRGVTYNKGQASETPVDGYIPVLRANNIQNDRLVLADLVYVDATLIKSTQKIRKNDVIVAMSSGSKAVVGKTARADEDIKAGFGAFCGLLRPTPQM